MICLKSCDVDKMAATKEWLLSEFEQLIAVWESCVCLWDVTSNDYKDRDEKKAAMLEMATKFETPGEFTMCLFINISVTCDMCTYTTVNTCTVTVLLMLPYIL